MIEESSEKINYNWWMQDTINKLTNIKNKLWMCFIVVLICVYVSLIWIKYPAGLYVFVTLSVLAMILWILFLIIASYLWRKFNWIIVIDTCICKWFGKFAKDNKIKYERTYSIRESRICYTVKIDNHTFEWTIDGLLFKDIINKSPVGHTIKFDWPFVPSVLITKKMCERIQTYLIYNNDATGKPKIYLFDNANYFTFADFEKELNLRIKK